MRQPVVHVDARQQFHLVEWFGDEIVRAVQKREVAVGVVFEGGHDNHREILDVTVLALANLHQQLMTRHVGDGGFHAFGRGEADATLYADGRPARQGAARTQPRDRWRPSRLRL